MTLQYKKYLAALLLSGALTVSSFTSCLAANNVSLTIENGQIKDVLNALASISGQSIIVDDSVSGTISIDLTDIPFDTALDLITRPKGLAYQNVHNVIVVSTYDNMNKYFGNVTILKLQHAKASELLTSLKDIVKGNGLSSDDITNSLIFTGNSSEEAKLRQAVKLLDVATKQVTLEAKIISLSNEDSRNLGMAWDWDPLPSPEDSDSDTTYGGIIHLGHGYTTRFQATLNALFSSGKAKILATPRIITIPGKEASIFIGDHIPVTTEKNTDGETTVSTEYVDAGIKLSYTPVISEDNIITSVVHTEVSTPTLVSELRNYRITSRTADTHVRMRNGETLIIGGLINEEEQKNIQKVPLLSNIPILGELFKLRTTNKTKTEVMMILTPYVTEAGESPAIYDNRVKNASITPVPGSEDDEDAKAIAREEKRIEQAKANAARTGTLVAQAKEKVYQDPVTSSHKETMKEKAERLLREREERFGN